MEVISCRDYHENYYHGLMVGLFVGKKMEIFSNDESGKGLPDIVIEDAAHDRCAVIEVKRARPGQNLASLARNALGQIAKNEYDAPGRHKYGRILHWGMAFQGKTCLALCETVRP